MYEKSQVRLNPDERSKLLLVLAGPVRTTAGKSIAHVLGAFPGVLGDLLLGATADTYDGLTLELDDIAIPVTASEAFGRIRLFDRDDLVGLVGGDRGFDR